MLKYFLAIVTLTIQLSHGSGEPIRINGMTLEGMPFSGTLSSAGSSILEIQDSRSGSIGLPCSRIDWIHLTRPPEGIHLLEALGNTPGLLELWDQETLLKAYQAVRQLAEQTEWPAVYRWTHLLGPVITQPQLKFETGLLRARAVHEMGLFKRAAQELESLQAMVEPLTAPLEYCRLKARLARRNGDTKAAQYWSSLPSLRIPSIDNES